MIDPKQAEEVKKLCNRVKQKFTIRLLSACLALGLISGILSIVIFDIHYGAHKGMLDYAPEWAFTFFVDMMIVVFSLLRIFKIKSYGVYETDKSIDECWEEEKSMEIYSVVTFTSTKILDRKDDELTFEMSARDILGHVIKKTMRYKRTEEKYHESMKIEVYIDDKVMAQDRIRIKSIDNKTVTEFDTEYTIKKNLLEYLLHRTYASYNSKIMEKLGYIQKEYQLKLSLAK